MTYKVYSTAQGNFWIDWETCCQIIKSFHRANSQNTNAVEITESQRSRWNPLTWKLPDLTYLDVNWDKVRDDTTLKTNSTAWRLAAFANFDAKGIDKLVRDLKGMQSDTRRYNNAFAVRQRNASAKSLAAMTSAVAAYQSDIDRAKMVRDLSGSVLIGAATAATGGVGEAALLGAGLGTGLKTFAKYQDTGSVGAATVEAAQNIMFTFMPAARGARLFHSEEVMKVIVSAVLETDGALLEGTEINTALARGAISVGASGASTLAKEIAGPALNRMAVPVTTRVLAGQERWIGRRLTGEVAQTVLEDGLKDAGQKKLERGETREVSAALSLSRNNNNSWGEVMSLHDDMLLKLAVIDQSKGVGGSWW